jgi:hypothetical protein
MLGMRVRNSLQYVRNAIVILEPVIDRILNDYRPEKQGVEEDLNADHDIKTLNEFPMAPCLHGSMNL